MPQGDEQGVVFPREQDGRRSTTATGRAVWADAVRGVDPALAQRIEAARDWRKQYVDLVVAHTAAAPRTAAGSVEVARAGLASLAGRMRFDRDGTSRPGRRRGPVRRRGARDRRPCAARARAWSELAVPYRAEVLRGDALRRQLDAWVARGTSSRRAAQALHRVVDAPGVARPVATGPSRCSAPAPRWARSSRCCSWGAHVVGRRRPEAAGLGAAARDRPGRAPGRCTHPRAADGPGVDLLTQTPEVAALPADRGRRPAADHRQLRLRRRRAARAGRARQRRRRRAAAARAAGHQLRRARHAHRRLRRAAGGRRRRPPPVGRPGAGGRWRRRRSRGGPREPVRPGVRHDGRARGRQRRVGIADVLVPQQGPNYTLAKRVQRWRAIVAAGRRAPGVRQRRPGHDAPAR